MNFLTPWMLYGLGALAVPVAIHLWQRRRAVETPFSTLRFLKLAASRTRRSSRIENVLLLLLRCLLIALLALAVARPVMLARSARIFGGEIPRTVVLILDNSASMGCRAGGQARLDAAKACARAVLDDLRQGDRVAVIAAGDRAELLVAEPTIDHALARKAVEEVPLSQTRSDFGPALREAGKIAARAERGLRQVFLFSDNQASGWENTLAQPGAAFGVEWKQSEPQWAIVRPDALEHANACVKEVRITSPFLVPGGTVRGTATVQNFAPAPLNDLVTLRIGEERVAQRAADIPPGATVEIPFEFQAPFTAERWVRGSASLSGDALESDDTFFFSLPVYRPPRVTVAEGSALGPERLRPGYFLRKALAAGTESVIPVRSIPAAQLDETALESETAVFLADPGHLSDRSVARLERFLEGGGTVVLFPGDQTALAEYANATFLPARPAASRTLPAGRQPVHIAEPAHPIFADAWDTGAPFPALPQQRLLDWQLAPAARTLLTLGSAGNGGLPFLIYGERGAGCVVIVNASADRTWGDLPLSPAFVPLVQQIARFSAVQGGRPPRLHTGDPLPLPASIPRDKPLTLTLPDGSARPLRSPGPGTGAHAILLERAEAAGFYRIAAGEESTLLAVNIGRAESRLLPLDPAALGQMPPDTHPTLLTGRDALVQWLARSKGLVPLWPLLLLLALAVFVAEEMLANHMARRRSQSDSRRILTGRLHRRRMGVPFYGEPTPPPGEDTR